ncbi:unnamed protein product [Paramecium octaurelia]|uniref:Uncharacterized protein n=1 Tax=Paramecium octaurelia TaxID=43137 RepID=A0A8S1T3D7_PAROT|nr:unnamed protein product [Paramecium octaurelia]
MYYIILLILLALVLYYFLTCRCQLDYVANDLNTSIINRCSIIKKKMFYYTPYLFTGLLQAIIASKVQDVDPKLKFVREYVDFGKDFGCFALDWGSYEGKISEKEAKMTEGKPLVVVLSGLTASRVEPYITNFFSKFCQNQSDWRIVLYNDRLFNNRIYLDPQRQILPQKGNFHHVEDFRRVLEYIAKQHNKSTIYAIGHSFGSNTLLKYLGMCGSNGTDPLIKVAVSVGNPYDFQLGMRYLEDSLSDSYIRKHRQRIAREKIDQYLPIPKHINLDLNKVQQAKTSLEFDTYFTKPIFGAPSVDFHYLSIQCTNYMEFVKIPVFFLGSFDDPVINNRAVYPRDAILKNPNLISLMTQVGGHISWFEGVLHPKRWYYKPVLQYLNAIHQLL